MLSWYHQVPLTKESQDLTTFIMPYGCYRFCHQSMGMKQTSHIFCKVMDAIISGTKEYQEIMGK